MLVHEINGGGTTAVMVTHDMGTVEGHKDREDEGRLLGE
jgi:ABC-type ATPase involved in cell division